VVLSCSGRGPVVGADPTAPSVGGRPAHPADAAGRPAGGAWEAHRYTRRVRFLFVCTANLCRSPMAAALFSRETEKRGEPVETSSAGILRGGDPVPAEVLEVMAPYGLDLSAHRSRALTGPELADADLVVGMGRRHVQEAVLLDGACWPRAFTLKALVERGRAVGPREPDTELSAWLDSVHHGRTRPELARRSSLDEVADPYGGPLAGYRAVATELAELTAALAGLLWPPVRGQVGAAGT
jgi:protein-tyrosine phosphatase